MHRLSHYLDYPRCCLYIIAIIIALSTACNTRDNVDLQLPTWDPEGATGARGATAGRGVLQVSEECVYLIVESDTEILLLWPEPTAWNILSQSIDFVSVDGKQFELKDSDEIIPGGRPMNPPSPKVTIPPKPSCNADQTFVVNSVMKVED